VDTVEPEIGRRGKLALEHGAMPVVVGPLHEQHHHGDQHGGLPAERPEHAVDALLVAQGVSAPTLNWPLCGAAWGQATLPFEPAANPFQADGSVRAGLANGPDAPWVTACCRAGMDPGAGLWQWLVPSGRCHRAGTVGW
jgi:hypothetical protein